MYTVLKNGKTYEELIQEVDDLNIYYLWHHVMRRLYPNHFFDNSNSLNVREDIYYDNIHPWQMVNDDQMFSAKFPYSIYQDEETQYKSSLRDDLTIWFDAKEIEKDLKERLAQMDIVAIAPRLGISFVNLGLYIDGIISTGNESLVMQFEAEDLLYQSELIILEEDADSISSGSRKRAIGGNVLDYIIDLNEAKQLTPEQFNVIWADADLQNIERACLNGSLVTARFLINAYTPDGVIMLQSDKDKMLRFIDRELSKL